MPSTLMVPSKMTKNPRYLSQLLLSLRGPSESPLLQNLFLQMILISLLQSSFPLLPGMAWLLDPTMIHIAACLFFFKSTLYLFGCAGS